MNYFMDISRLHTFEMAEKHIYPVLVNRESLAEYQDEAVKMYVTGTDLGLTFRVRLGKESCPEIIQAIVSEEMLESWGITEDELKEVAFSNLQREVEMESLTDVCGMPGAEDNIIEKHGWDVIEDSGSRMVIRKRWPKKTAVQFAVTLTGDEVFSETLEKAAKDSSSMELRFDYPCSYSRSEVESWKKELRNELIEMAREAKTQSGIEVGYSRLLQILQDYVYNDVQAADTWYVRDALEMCGVDKAEAEKLGLGYIFENIEE